MTVHRGCRCARESLGPRGHAHSGDPGLEWDLRLRISNHHPGGTLLQVHRPSSAWSEFSL